MSGLESSNAENGAVGVAGGISFIGIVHLLPPTWHALSDTLIFLSPVISVVGGFSWKLLRIQIAKRTLNRQLEAAITTAHGYRDKIHADANATEDHKANAQRSVENLEQLRFEALQNNYERVQAHLTQGL